MEGEEASPPSPPFPPQLSVPDPMALPGGLILVLLKFQLILSSQPLGPGAQDLPAR